MIFLGTPHRGSETEEYGQVLTNIAQAIIREPIESDQRLYNALQTSCDSLLQLTHVFVSLIDCPIYSFNATKPDKHLGILVSEINKIPNERELTMTNMLGFKPGANCPTLVGAAREEHIPLDTDYEGLFSFDEIENPILVYLSKQISRMHQHSGRILVRSQNYAKILPALPIKCPVCRTLSFDKFQLGLDCASLQYTASLDPEERISLALWAHRCVLANFVGQSSAVWAHENRHYVVNQVPVLSLASEFTCSPAYDTVQGLHLSREYSRSSQSRLCYTHD